MYVLVVLSSCVIYFSQITFHVVDLLYDCNVTGVLFYPQDVLCIITDVWFLVLWDVTAAENLNMIQLIRKKGKDRQEDT
jgi:hypothetical protein